MKIPAEKLYKNMTPKELACIAFGHLSKHDEVALSELVSQIPRHLYRLPDIDYIRYLEGITVTALYWGMTFWKQAMLYSISNVAELGNEEDRDKNVRNLRACFVAMQRLCKAYGISFEAVRHYLDVRFEENYLENCPPEESVIQGFYNELEKMLLAWVPQEE